MATHKITTDKIATAEMLQLALQHLATVIRWRLTVYFSSADSLPALGTAHTSIDQSPALLQDWLLAGTALARFVTTHQLNIAEQLTLLIALAPHLQPDFFDVEITSQLPDAGDYPQIGGWRGVGHRGFLPTGETVLFVLAGGVLCDRILLHNLFSPSHFFAQQGILSLQPSAEGEPLMSGRLILSPDYVHLFIQGTIPPPQLSIHFPAQHITTEMSWDDLVLNSQTRQQIEELKTWVVHSPTLLNDWGMKHKLKLGCCALFHGPPGTGKTLTASLLGKYTQKSVYKIDISMVTSKFIGETEKNLASLFAKAESKGWILFFDEADALFGKRTSVRDAHDKYANQEVSYLLQRIENYDGLVILASNLKSNIDDAFIRRFQSIIHFPLPDAVGRSHLWKLAFPPQVKLDDDINLTDIAEQYELSGADILNVVQYCCLRALQRGDRAIIKSELLLAIKQEYKKVGKLLT